MDELSAKYVKVVLKAFGPNLKKLSLARIKNLSLEDLVPCDELEDLHIFIDCHVDCSGVDFMLEKDSFLPKLKKLKTMSCLGHWSRLLEVKSETLTDIELHCCHIGTKVTIFLFSDS